MILRVIVLGLFAMVFMLGCDSGVKCSEVSDYASDRVSVIRSQIRRTCVDFYERELVERCVSLWEAEAKKGEYISILYDVDSGGKCIELDGSSVVRSINEELETIVSDRIPYCYDYPDDVSCPAIEPPKPPEQSSSSAEYNSSSSSRLSSSSSRLSSSSSSRIGSSSSRPSSSSSQTLYCPNVSNGSNSMTCGGKTYKTVGIGGQVWMAENLNYNAIGSVCYDNQSSYCAEYGRLYDWTAAMGACPQGWHLPNRSEWNALISYIEGDNGCAECAAKYLKTGAWGGLDSYGFSALPGGHGISGGYIYNINNNGYWWSASNYTSESAYYWSMGYNYDNVSYSTNGMSYLYSVRCVKD